MLAWVDRFAEQPSIQAAVAPNLEGMFGESLTIYNHTVGVVPLDSGDANTGQVLSDMLSSDLWSFGLPFALTTGRGDVLVAYYSGSVAGGMSFYIARLRV